MKAQYMFPLAALLVMGAQQALTLKAADPSRHFFPQWHLVTTLPPVTDNTQAELACQAGNQQCITSALYVPSVGIPYAMPVAYAYTGNKSLAK